MLSYHGNVPFVFPMYDMGMLIIIGQGKMQSSVPRNKKKSAQPSIFKGYAVFASIYAHQIALAKAKAADARAGVFAGRSSKARGT